MIDDEQFKYFNPEADHWAVICHENTHSLGPDSHTVGKYSAIIEEFKADMGIYSFLNEFIEAGVLTERDKKEIIVSELTDSFLKAKPILTQAHRVRTVMILNRLFREKGIILDKKNTLSYDFDKVISTSRTMMSELIDIQLSGSVAKAEQYINKYFKWTKEMQVVADIKKKSSKLLNGKTTAPLSTELNKIK